MRILLVEDDLTVAHGLTLILKGSGAIVETHAATGRGGDRSHPALARMEIVRAMT